MPRPPLPDGCLTAVELSGLSNEAAVAQMAMACAVGMAPVLPRTATVRLGEGERHQINVSIEDATRCLRAVAVGGLGVRDLTLAILDQQNRRIGQDEIVSRFGLAGQNGPICGTSAGEYRVLVEATKGAGSISVQLYQVADAARSHSGR